MKRHFDYLPASTIADIQKLIGPVADFIAANEDQCAVLICTLQHLEENLRGINDSAAEHLSRLFGSYR